MDFVILPKEKPQFEIEQVFSFHFGKHGDYGIPAGRYQGNIQDPEFAKKLWRVRARLFLKNVSFWEAVSAVTMKEVKRLNDKERYDRKDVAYLQGVPPASRCSSFRSFL